MKQFALIGVAGFVAPRHLKAIRETGNNLVAALDKSDSVGILDTYFPEADFFVEFERFDRHLDMLKRKGAKIDYVSICSPNYLHDAHIRFGLRHKADVICEKPLVINPWNIESLQELEKETGKKVWTVLQLRYHPGIIALKKKVEAAPADTVFHMDLTYITSRGHWYHASWKGDETKSGGIAANIGIHFFDVLIWIFGPVTENIVHIRTHDRVSGLMKLQRASVRWFLSINADTLPDKVKAEGHQTFRSMQIEGEEIDYSNGFADLHTVSYTEILKGNGFGLAEAAKSIQVASAIKSAQPIGLKGDYHPLCSYPLVAHPFLHK